MNAPNFMQFCQMFLAANPQLLNNFQGGMGNPNFGMNNPNLINMMFQMMGMNGANPNNFINIFNPGGQQPQPKPPTHVTNVKYLNLIFIKRDKNIRITIHAEYKESIASVVNKYITKSGDNNINIYIVNGRRLDESLTVSQSALIDYSIINVIAVDELEGAN